MTDLAARLEAEVKAASPGCGCDNYRRRTLALARALRALEHSDYGSLFDMAVKLHRKLCEDETPRIGEVGALIELGRRQLVALAYIKESEGEA